jgi:hypothetical protein
VYDSTWLEIEGLVLTGDVGWDGEDISFEGIRFNNVSNTTVSDIEVSQTGGSLLVVTGETSALAIDSSSFSKTNGHAVVVGCGNLSCYTTDFIFSRNLVHSAYGGSGDLVYFHDGIQNAQITDNVIYGPSRNGVNLGHPDNGSPPVFERNVIWNVDNAGFIGRGPVFFRNNIIFNTGAQGVYFSNPGTTYEGLVLSFNTIVNTGSYGVELRNWHESIGNVFSNNTVCNPVGSSVYYQISEDAVLETEGHTISNNLLCGAVFNLSEDLGHFLLGYGFSDFGDVEGWDFYPAENSMLLNTADPAGENYIPEIDFNGVVRDGGAPEIGAYEWDGETNPGWQIQEGFKTYDLKDNISEEVVSEGCCSNNNSPEKALLLIPIFLLSGLRRRRS